ncbi:hypothetical protein ABFU82_19770 [Nocardioides sp. WV_118_6]
MEVVAGTISGAIVTLLPLLLRRRAKEIPTPLVHVSGNGNRTETSQHTTIVYADRPSRADARPGRGSGNDTEGEIAATLAGAVIAVLAFVLLWPLAVGALVGISLGNVALLARASALTPTNTAVVPRRNTLALGVVVTTTAMTTCALALFATPDSEGRGLRGIEQDLRKAFLDFHRPAGRWHAVVGETGEVIRVIGFEGMMMLGLQLAGLVFCAILTILLISRIVGWYAVIPQHRRTHPRAWRLRLGARFLDTDHVEIGVAVLGGILAVVLASGVLLPLFNADEPLPSMPTAPTEGGTNQPPG